MGTRCRNCGQWKSESGWKLCPDCVRAEQQRDEEKRLADEQQAFQERVEKERQREAKYQSAARRAEREALQCDALRSRLFDTALLSLTDTDKAYVAMQMIVRDPILRSSFPDLWPTIKGNEFLTDAYFELTLQPLLEPNISHNICGSFFGFESALYEEKCDVIDEAKLWLECSPPDSDWIRVALPKFIAYLDTISAQKAEMEERRETMRLEYEADRLKYEADERLGKIVGVLSGIGCAIYGARLGSVTGIGAAIGYSVLSGLVGQFLGRTLGRSIRKMSEIGYALLVLLFWLAVLFAVFGFARSIWGAKI